MISAPPNPAHGPLATPQARTGAAAHAVGIVDAPALSRAAVSIKRVLRISATATHRSRLISQAVRPAGRR
jgi:hypothetical protein